MNLYPETNLNQSNLGWIIAELKRLEDVVNAIAGSGNGNTVIVTDYVDIIDDTMFYIYMGNTTTDPISGYTFVYGHGYRKWRTTYIDAGLMFPTYPLAVTEGGTGAATGSDAITSLGITPAAIGAVDDDAIIDVSHGGTGAANAADAKTNLGISLANLGGEPAITSNNPLALTKGGTGATTQAGARSALGLGTAALLADPITVSHGGTGATSKDSARANLSALGSADVTYFQTDGAKIEGIAADANQSVELDVHHDGYTCVGVGSVFGSGTGYFTLYEYYFVRANGRDKVNLGFHNRTNAAHDLIPKVRCIYVKNV